MRNVTAFVASILVATSIGRSAFAQDTSPAGLANIKFPGGRPTSAQAQTLQEQLLFQRATQIYLWAMPLLNTLGMQVGSEKTFGSGYNVLPIWKKRVDSKTLITTANSDVLYAMSYVNLRETGPLVMDAPSELQGILLDYWQRPIPVDGGKYAGDVGYFGPDHGKGGKFLIVPPGFNRPAPTGYYVYRSGTYNVFIFLRGFYESPKNLTPAVEHLERTKIYPLDSQGSAKSMVFPDASGVPVNMLPRSDSSAFDELKYLVDTEGSTLAGSDWLGMLAAIGIIQGKPFAPDAKTRAILDQAARAGYNMSRVIGFQDFVSGMSYRIYPDRHWMNPFAGGTKADPTKPLNLSWENVAGRYLALDARTNFFTNYYSTSPGMVSWTPGKGANYLIAFTDSQGVALMGAKSYRLTLPPNVPAANFWSVTVYDAANSSGLVNGQPFPSVGSRDKPTPNKDGSVELYIGPHAPEGKSGNWIATVPGKAFFAILRLYGPTEARFDKSWIPGDIEPAK